MPLFEVAITRKPTPKEAEEGKTEELVLAPTAVVAVSRDAAIVKASGLVDTTLDANLITVHVRNFQ